MAHQGPVRDAASVAGAPRRGKSAAANRADRCFAPDFIGAHVLEVNITSPGLLVEMLRFCDFDIACTIINLCVEETNHEQ